MIARANTTVEVLRGTTNDDYGDPIDGSTAVATGIPASVLEQRRQVTTESDAQPRWVVYYTARLPSGTDVRSGDRIRDTRTGEVYAVDSYSRTPGVVLTADLRVDLRRVT